MQNLYAKQTPRASKGFSNSYNSKNSVFYLRSSKCYASLLYGTRKTFLVRFQQSMKKSFHNKLYNKFYFFNLELDFFQNLWRYYQK